MDEKNQNRKDPDFETGRQDQHDHHDKNDDLREKDRLNEHQNSTRRANPQTENGRKNMNSEAKPGNHIPRK